MQPWLGIEFDSTPDFPQKLIVKKIHRQSPAVDKIPLETVVIGIRGSAEEVMFSNGIRIEPLSFRNHQEYFSNLEEQEIISRILQNDQLELLTNEGESIKLIPEKSRPLRAIPGFFWGLLIANLSGLMIGVFVWSYKPNTLESGLLLLAGSSYFLFGLIFSVVISRELAMPAGMLDALTSVQAFFINIFSFSLFSIFSYYPVRLLPLRIILISSAVTLILSLNYAFKVYEIPLHIFFIPIIPLYFSGIYLGYLQWKVSRKIPVDRAAILLLILSVLIPVGIIILFYFIPVIIERPPLLGVISTRLVLLILFSGFALGILKYRLFEVENWWVKSWLWLLGGSTVAIIDIAFINLYSLNHSSALALSVIITGFIYFPMRQWLLDRFIPQKNLLDNFLPTFSKLISSSENNLEFEKRWITALSEKFSPANIEKITERQSAPRISENGLDLYCPGLLPDTGYRLSGKDDGTRLFDKYDLEMVASLQSMAKLASDTGNAREEAVRAERKRIMTDLHDSLGADLITLLHIADSPLGKKHAQRALQTLRDTVKISVNDEPGYLINYISQWRSEVVQRTELADVRLQWNSQNISTSQLLQADLAIKITNILREVINNGLKHAQPSCIKVTIELKNGLLMLKVCNDGEISDSNQWEHGVGLSSIQSKIKKHQGKFIIEQSDNWVCLKVELAL